MAGKRIHPVVPRRSDAAFGDSGGGVPARIPLIALLAAIFLASDSAFALSENDYFKPLGRPPEAKKKRIKGAEARPKVPGPPYRYTPLRRSERKRQPAPPTLIGKVKWGATADFGRGKEKRKLSDWNLVPADCQQLLKKAGKLLKLKYRYITVNLSTFKGDPSEIPVLYISGGRTLKLADEQIALLRKYVRSGGMIWIDSVAGSPFFYEGAVAVLKKAFPEQPLRPVPLDHPVFHMQGDVEKVALPEAVGSDKPALEAIYVGCRLGVVVSKYGLGCGWDNTTPDRQIKGALFYGIGDAMSLGLNLVGYAVGYQKLGLAHARPEAFGTKEKEATGDEFVFTQVQHDGVWNTDPGGPSRLLKFLASTTNVKVTFRRKTIRLGVDKLDDTQFLYLSGCHDMTLSSSEIESLRGFLGRGGTILIDNAQGLKAFDQAVRRELKKVFPSSGLQLLPGGHEIFASLHKISKVKYSHAVRRLHPQLEAPQLEGIQIDGDLRVIYSKYDLGGGWQGDEHPQAKAYDPVDALKLGTNIVIYAMTH